jgi:hypothetical protein
MFFVAGDVRALLVVPGGLFRLPRRVPFDGLSSYFVYASSFSIYAYYIYLGWVALRLLALYLFVSINISFSLPVWAGCCLQ